MNGRVLTAALGLALGLTGCGGGNTAPQGGDTAQGAERTAKTAALETGAKVLQAKAPVENIAIYLNGFHVSNHDGEATAAMVADRDRRLNLDTADERTDRQDLIPLATPQGGVAAIAGRFPNATPVSGVTDNGDAATRPIPHLE